MKTKDDKMRKGKDKCKGNDREMKGKRWNAKVKMQRRDGIKGRVEDEERMRKRDR